MPWREMRLRASLRRRSGVCGRRPGALAVAALAGLLVSSFHPAAGQEMPVPLEVQASLLTRIVQFDRSFDARSEDGLAVGLVFQSDYRASVLAKDGFSRALAVSGFKDAQGEAVRIVELEAGAGLAEALADAGVDILYVAPLRGVDLAGLSEETRRLRILSCTGVPDYAREGVAVGFDAQGGRPRILINLPSATAEGSDFRPGLLQMAQLIREDG